MPLFRAIIFHLGEESRVKTVHMFRTPKIQENRTAKYFYLIKLFAHILYIFVYMLAIAAQTAGPNRLKFFEGAYYFLIT